MTPDAAVKVRGLVKRYGDFTALDGLDLVVPAGSFYAFLGPNGAGKSTTLSILTCVYAPDAGEVEVLGLDALARPMAVKGRIGVVPEELALFERLTGRQSLSFCGRMYGLDREVAARRAEELLELVELSGKGNELVAAYSKGMRRRLAIASSLIHAPEVLFLDEPFEGIDVVASGVIRDLLRELSRTGVTIVLTTHILEVAERLATHVGVIRAGRMVDEGPIEDLRARHASDSLEGAFERLIGVSSARGNRISFYGNGGGGPAR